MKPILAATLAWACLAGPALADHRGGRDDIEHASRAAIAQERARAIAEEQGVARVREIESRRGLWKVEGYTEEGVEIEVEIDAESGAVVKRELY